MAFLCTAEHVLPKSLGGKTNRANIAAACQCCNKRRGNLKDSVQFSQHVRRRCKAGKWHSIFPKDDGDLYVAESINGQQNSLC